MLATEREPDFPGREHRQTRLPMTEERGKYLLSLVRFALPLSEQAGDGRI